MNKNWKIPTIQQIYNQYHRQTFYAQHKFYPKSITNFQKILSDKHKVQLLTRFQITIKRNREALDWKLYIKAVASVMGNRFDLKLLGSLGGNRIYRSYVNGLLVSTQDSQTIYNDIIRSLTFLTAYLKQSQITFKQYIQSDTNTVPLLLRHIYAGTISTYFYSCFDQYAINNIFQTYHDDIFQQLFNMNKDQFITKIILNKRSNIIKYPKILEIIQKIQKLNLL